MQTTIHAYDPETRTVKVTFTTGGIVHERGVNACLDAAGEYDQPATEARIADVARGVARKIEVGAIVNPPEIVMPEPMEPVVAEDAGEIA